MHTRLKTDPQAPTYDQILSPKQTASCMLEDRNSGTLWEWGLLGIQRGAEGGGAELSLSQCSFRVIFCLSCHVTPSAKGKKKKKDLLVPKGMGGGGVGGGRGHWERLRNT